MRFKTTRANSRSKGGIAIEELTNDGIIIYVVTAKEKLHKAITRNAMIMKLSYTHSGLKGKQRTGGSEGE